MEKDFCSIEEELEHKMAKIMKFEDSLLENSSQDQNLSAISTEQNSSCPTFFVSEDAKNKGEVPLLDTEERKGISSVSADAIRGEVPLLDLKETKDVPMVLDDAKDKGDVPLSESEVRKEFCIVSNETEERKEVSIASGDANTKEINLLESEEQMDVSIASTIEEKGLTLNSFVMSSSAWHPRKILLVLDLNGLLADIISHPPKDFTADINIAGRAIFKRPFCVDFMKFCFRRFEVGIWSSRKQKNVERITDYLLGDLKHKLLFCWDISYCAKTTVGSLENRYKYVVFKELRRLWEKQDANLPWEKGHYNETNTLLLDDSPYKALLNPPHTAVFPHSYDYRRRTDNSLGEGGDLRIYLEKLAEAKNVQEFVKNNPFGQEAINETSDSWEFYSRLLSKTKPLTFSFNL